MDGILLARVCRHSKECIMALQFIDATCTTRMQSMHTFYYLTVSIIRVLPSFFFRNGIVLLQAAHTIQHSQSVHMDTYSLSDLFICLSGVLRRFQHCTGHITTSSWKGRGNQYIQFARVLYCKLPTNGKQLPAFPLEAVTGIKPRPQRWEARVLPLCHRGPLLPQ